MQPRREAKHKVGKYLAAGIWDIKQRLEILHPMAAVDYQGGLR